MSEAKDYGMRKRLELPYAEAVERVVASLKEEGFGILTEIDLRATFKKKLDADFKRYVILGACNPQLAFRALEAELELGLLLPCNVIVYEDGEGSVVSIADPHIMMQMTEAADLGAVATEARQKLAQVLAKL